MFEQTFKNIDDILHKAFEGQLIMDNCQLKTSVVPILGTIEISKEKL